MKKLLLILALVVTIPLFVSTHASALTWSTDNPDGILVSWTPNSESDLAGYELSKTDAINGTYVIQHPGLLADTTFLDSSVEEMESYWYKLRAVDACGNVSGFSVASDETIWDMTKPVPTTGFTAQVNMCDGRVILTWDSHPDAYFKTFHVSRSLSSEGPFTEVYVGTDPSWSEIFGVTGGVYYRIVSEDEACWLSDLVTLRVDVISDTQSPESPAW